MTSVALMLVWSLSWSPYAGVFLANIAGRADLVTNHVDMIPGQLLLHNQIQSQRRNNLS